MLTPRANHTNGEAAAQIRPAATIGRCKIHAIDAIIKVSDKDSIILVPTGY